MRRIVAIFSFVLIAFSNVGVKAGVMDQSGFDAWYQEQVAPHVPEHLRIIMNPAAARLIMDEVKLGNFYGPSLDSPSKENVIPYLTYAFHENLEPFLNHSTLALVRAFFPCPEGAIFVHSQALSNPLSYLSVLEGGKILRMLMDPQTLTVEKVYGFLRGQLPLDQKPWNTTLEQPLSRDETLNGEFTFQCHNLAKFLITKLRVSLEDEIANQLILERFKECISKDKECEKYFDGRAEHFFNQYIAFEELDELRKKVKDLKKQRQDLLKLLERQTNPNNRIKTQTKLDGVEEKLKRIQTLEDQIPDLNILDQSASYYLSQVTHLLMDAFQKDPIYPLNPHLALKTILAFAYSKAASKDEIRSFFEAFLGVPLDPESPAFKGIQPFTSVDYVTLKKAVADQTVTDAMATLENIALYRYGQRAFEVDSRYLLTYGNAIVNNKSFSNCVETSLLNLLVLKLQRGEFFDLSKLPRDALPELRTLLTTYNAPEHFECVEAKNAFASMVSFIPGIHYVQPASAPEHKRTFEVYAGFLNAFKIMAFLFKDEDLLRDLQNPELDMDDAKGAEFLQRTLGDEFEIVDSDIEENPTIKDYTGKIDIQFKGDKPAVDESESEEDNSEDQNEDENLNKITFSFNNTNVHSWVEMVSGGGQSEMSHPLLCHPNFSNYPGFEAQIMALSLRAPAVPEPFPIMLTEQNVWGVAAALSKQPEMHMWFSWALVTQGLKSHETLAVEMLSKVVENNDTHLLQYFLKLHHISPFPLEVQRRLIIKESEFLDYSIDTDLTSLDDRYYKTSPLLNFLEDPEIIDIARQNLEFINNEAGKDPVYNERSKKLFHMIASDTKPWNIKFINGFDFSITHMQNYGSLLKGISLSNLCGFLNNSKIKELRLQASFSSVDKKLPIESVDQLRQFKAKEIDIHFFSVSSATLQQFLGAMLENPHQQSDYLRKITMQLSNSVGDIFSPEALNYMNGLPETLKDKVFIKTVVTSPTYEATFTPLMEFFTKDDGDFAKQALGFKQ